MWNEVLENLVVVKRSGQRVEFNASKIAIAIKKAFDAVYREPDEKNIYKVFESVLKYINSNYGDRKTINVEDIQDTIEKQLNELNFKEVYEAFRDYRQKRAASRKVFNEKQQHKFSKVAEAIENIDTSLTPTQMVYKFGKIISSEYAKSYILDSKFVRAYEEGNMYIHNLEAFPLGYISYLNLKLDIKNNDLDEFINNMVNAQNEVSSEIGINNIDTLLENYFLNYFKKVLKQKVKCYFEINGMYELIPFNKIENMIDQIDDIDIGVNYFEQFTNSPVFKNVIEYIIKDTYESTKEFIKSIIIRIFNTLKICRNNYTISVSNKLDSITACIKENIIEYLSNNEPISNIHVVFKINKKTDDAYLTKISNLILKQENVSLSFDCSYNKDSNNDAEYFSNGIRIFETLNDNEKISTGRMISTNTSINIARLGLKYLNNKNNSNFYQELDQLLELAKNEMLLDFETLGDKNKENYNVLFKGNVYGDERLEPGQKIRKIIKGGVLNVGLVGLKECVLSFETDPDKQYALLIKILEHLNKKMREFSNETKLFFSIFEPSSIKVRKHFVGIDKSIYGIHKDITEKCAYDLIHTAKFIKSDKDLAKVQKLLSGGCLIKVNITHKTTAKQVIELIRNKMDNDVGFIKFEVTK